MLLKFVLHIGMEKLYPAGYEAFFLNPSVGMERVVKGGWLSIRGTMWLFGLLFASCAAVTPPIPVGYLEGKVIIGPLRPVQRAEEPASRVPPEVYAAYPIKIFKPNGQTWVADVKVGPGGAYRVALAPDTYVVALAGANIRISRGGDLPKTITIASGQTVRLDIDIDTGMR
jgi:hypothetical protein